MGRGKNYHIRPIPLCKCIRDKSQWTYRMDYGKKVSSSTYVWYIENSDPKLLVDAGIQAEQYEAHGLTAEHVQSLEEGLERVGVRTEDIDIVILTHLHFDHIALAHKFNRGKFIIQRKELDFARNPHPMVASGYSQMAFKDLNFEVVDGDTEIIDRVGVLLTPGHTPGTQSIWVETPKGLAIITGFCCTRDNFNVTSEAKAKGLEVIAPGIHVDALQAYDSALKVKRAAEIILPIHDIEFMDKSKIP